MDSKLISSHCICRVCLIKVNIYIYQSLCKNFRGSWLAHKKVCRHNCLATVWPGCQKGTSRELQVQLLKQKGLGVVRGSTIYRMGTGERTCSLCRAGVNSLLCCLLNSCSWFMCRIGRSYCHTHTERHRKREREGDTHTHSHPVLHCACFLQDNQLSAPFPWIVIYYAYGLRCVCATCAFNEPLW